MFQIREDRSPQGRKKLHTERAKYFELIAGGVGFNEAAGMVGVSYHTTKRWRNGERTQRKPGPAAVPLRPRPYRASLSSRFLRETDRIFIADRLVAGWSIRQIGRASRSGTVDDQPRSRPQPQSEIRSVSAVRGAGSRRRSAPSPEGREDRCQPGVARLHSGEAGQAMESGGDLPHAASRVP